MTEFERRFSEVKTQFGFSLVEVMFTVAIFGIGATLAAPSYNSMIARSRQSEARSELAQIYSREQAYFAEFGRYTLCLWFTGYEPPSGAGRYYTTGYNNGSTDGVWNYGGLPEPQPYPVPPPAQDCVCGPGQPWGDSVRNDCTFVANRVANPAMAGAGIPTTLTARKTGFNAGAWGSISGANILDVWQINEQKVVTHLQSGL